MLFRRRQKEKEPEILTISDEYIKLGQALKLAGMVGSGVDAKMLIQNEEVFVNGKVETRRGRKLYEGDIFTYEGESFRIAAQQTEA